MRKILVATDLTDASVPALRTAFQLVHKYNAALTALHVTEPPAEPPRWRLPFRERAGVPTAAQNQQLQATAKNVLCDLIREVDGDPESVDVRVVSGQPASAIASMAAQVGADIVVVGTHGRRGFRHMVIGSVAEKVVRIAPCDVLTVKSEGLRMMDAADA